MSYVPVKTIPKLDDSVNCLQLDQKAELLAVGCDDGRFRVYDIRGDVVEMVKFRVPNVAVTSLLWHPTEASLIFIGYSDGGVVECRLSSSAQHVRCNRLLACLLT